MIKKLFAHQAEIEPFLLGHPRACLFWEVGCVDKDTEYFNGIMWKKISEYTDGELVLQHNPETGYGELTKPLKYIKELCDKFIHFETKYGLSQTLSYDHRMLCRFGSLWKELSVNEFIESHNKRMTGFNGDFKCSFKYSGKGINLTDIEIKIMLAVIADGHFTSNTNRVNIHIKKEYKIIELCTLLTEANILFKCVTQDDYSNISFYAPRHEKEFTDYWYNCNQHQLQVICDNVDKWDGCINKKHYNTTIKQSADFIQFVYSSCGYRTSINIDDRRGRLYNGYETKSILYRVVATLTKNIGYTTMSNNSKKPKNIISEIQSEDGYKYCFTVSTHELILRKDNCIFVTGNCGKTNAVINAVNRLPRGNLLIAAPKCVIEGMWKKYDDLVINQNVTMINYEYLSRHLEYANKTFDYIILDEVHRIKSHKSKSGKIIKALTKKSKYSWGITGTPYATSFLDIHGIFTNMGISEFTTYYDKFMHEIYNCEVAAIVGQKIIYKPVSLKEGMLDYLTKKISRYANVLRAMDCVTLPTLSIIEVKCEGMRTKQYVDACKGIITYTLEQNNNEPEKATVNKLAALQKLHQLSNGFVYDDTPDKKVIQFKVNSKLEELKNIVQMELEERDKLIICYHYKYDYLCLVQLMKELGISYTNDMEYFGTASVLLLQEGKAIGTNLQAFTSCMIFYTYDYAYLKFEQAKGRIYRSGQKEPCKVYIMINSGTSEKKIWGAVNKNMGMDTLFKELMTEF